MTTSQQWIKAIREASSEPDPARSNRLITQLHYALSEALAESLGHDAGPNFHSWAVWGSRKAGITIRQEDLGSAIRNATVTAGAVGTVAGGLTGLMSSRRLGWSPDSSIIAFGATIGGLAGAYTGRQLAVWSRAKAAALILKGNQIVLQDIGEQSARFLELLQAGARRADRETFFAGLRPGPTEKYGQDRLTTAFHSYLKAFDSKDQEQRRAAMIAANQEIVFHEHIRLEPYIHASMPFIIRHCATQRLMTYEVGRKVLTVGEDVPGVPGSTAARDWTKIEDRMRYIFALFREFHNMPEVFERPYPTATS